MRHHTPILLLLGAVFLQGQDLDILIDGSTQPRNKEASLLDDLIEGRSKGYPVRLVQLDSPRAAIDDRLFWHTYKGLVTASAIPDEFSVDGEPIMQTTVGQKRVLEGPLPTLKPATGFAKLEKRVHILNPGRIKINAPGGNPETDHPAVLIDKTPQGTSLRIQLSPVVFESLTEDGQPVSFHPEIVCAEKPLLSKSLRFRKITLWLPIGLTYDSSFGRFRIESDGTILYAEEESPENVTFTGRGFLRKHPARATQKNQPVENPEFLVFRRNNKNLRIYTALWVEPGNPLLIALSASQYEEITSKPFKAGAILGKPRNSKPIRAQKAGPASPGLEAHIAQVLECAPGDIAWSSLRLGRDPEQGPASVQFEVDGLGTVRRNILVLGRGKGLHLQPHRKRTIFTPDERAPIHAFIGSGFPGGTASLIASPISGGKNQRRELARIKLPPNPGPGHDSRLLELETSSLMPGRYNLHMRLNDEWQSQACPVTITHVPVSSPFIAYVKDWFGNIDDHESLQILEDANIRFLANGPRLQSTMPRIHNDLQRRLQFGFDPPPPPETVSALTYNDRMMGSLLQHRIGQVDFAPVRRDAIYNEGHSYHHSFQPDVDRMVRRLQIFTRQTLDHPNALGITLGIDPRHQGNRSGFGTPTDANVEKRSQALVEALKTRGLAPLPREDFQFLQNHPRSPDPAVRKKADILRQRDLSWWHASAEESYEKHNTIYSQAVRKVRPGAKILLFEESELSREHNPLETFIDASIYYAGMNSGDWPMATAFSTDWALAHAPGRPVWMTVEKEGASEGMVKGLLHAFARGLQGGGIDLPPNEDTAELKRRAGFMQFLTQYGAIAKFAKPDQSVTIVTTAAKQRYIRNGIFDYHVAYNFFTRLGFPPGLIHERVFETPTRPGLLVLVNEEHDLLQQTRSKLKDAHQKGCKILAIGIKPRDIPVDIHIEKPLLSIHKNTRNPGFGPESHQWLWDQFLKRKKELGKVLETAGLRPRASTDAGLGYVLTLDDGPIRYVCVIADRERSHPGKIVREPALPIILDGTWAVVRDLRLQQDLQAESRNGRTHVSVSLETEPCTLLALLPENLATHDQYRAPACIQVHNAKGDLLEKHFGTLNNPRPKTPGILTIQELLTGLTVKSTLPANPPEKSVHTAPEVHVMQPLTIIPRLILLEAGREKIVPVAQELAIKLDARLWQLQPDDFDEHPFRWQPKPDDHTRIDRIARAQLVGYRKSLSAYLDAEKRHNPALGGYRSLNPPYMVGQDCILFSGGELGNSLKEVSSWLDTPSSPGRGQARILNIHSPFFSGKQAVCLVANDLEGFQKAASHLARLKVPEPLQKQDKTLPSDLIAGQSIGQKPVSTPFRNYSAHRHVDEVRAAPNGQAAILFSEENGTALVSPDGTTTVAIKPLEKPVRILPDGSLWAIQTYGDDTGHLAFRKIDPKGKLLREFEVRDCFFRPDGAKDAPALSPDGRFAVVGRPGEILFIDLEDGTVRTYDDTPNIRHRYSAFYPRVPVSTTFSPNGKYLLVTIDSRPPISGINTTTFRPTFSATLLLDTENPASPAWILDDEKSRRATYAVHQGFAAVANNGTSAIAGYDGEIFIIDPTGKILGRQKANSKQFGGSDRRGPIGGVGVSIAGNGGIAGFAFRKKLFLWHNDDFQEINMPQGIVSLVIPSDGSRVHLSTDSGILLTLDPDGKELWTQTMRPNVHLANIDKGNLLAADGAGNIHLLSADGKLLRKTNAWKDSLPRTRQIQRPPGFRRDSEITHYVEPDTLEVARKTLDARKLDEWEPTGQARKHHGKTFHHLDGQISFNTGDAENTFLHLVYHKDKPNTQLAVEIEGRTRKLFNLDLPTPAYRVTDIPVQGSNVTINIRLNRSIGIAECSLWSIHWPGPNLAYQPPTTTLLELEKETEKKPSLADDLLGDDLLNDLKQDSNKNQVTPLNQSDKKLRIWWPNTDPLRTRGRFLAPKVDPRLIVDRKRFNGSRDQTLSWTNYHAPWGGSFTMEFGKPQKISLIATYDRTTRQSQVSKALMVFNGIPRNEHDSPAHFGTIINNDQFWRLVPIPGRKLKTLGVHAFSGSGPDGLSEIEVYP